MKSNFFRIVSAFLSLVFLINLLPLHSLAESSSAEDGFSTSIESIPVSGGETQATALKAAKIVCEIEGSRTRYSKEFQLNNGLRMSVLYGEPVHYEDDGAWKEIDNTLKLSGNEFVNTAGELSISFPQQISDQKYVSITKEGNTLRFSMTGELRTLDGLELSRIGESTALQASNNATAEIKDINMASKQADIKYPETMPDKLNSRLQYSNLFSNTDVVYDINSNRVKESVVIKGYDPKLQGYRYSLDVGNMVPMLSEDGQISLYGKDGKIVMIMAAPFLEDAAGAYCDDVHVTLTGKGSNYVLTYLLPQSWLASSERQWPVVLDPVVDADIADSNIQDASVYEVGQAYDYTADRLDVGHNTTYGIMRAFLKYETLPAITSAEVIVDASLTMYKFGSNSQTNPIEVHAVQEAWTSSTVSWTEQPEYDDTVEDHAIIKDGGYYHWNIVDMVRGWYENENYGLVLKAPQWVENTTETTSYRKQFRSSNYTASYRPVLTITYRNNNGLENYWDYTASSAGRAGTGYVNNYTGNLVWVHSDIGYGGNRMPVSISHVYNTSDITNTDPGMGYGWRTNFNQTVSTQSLDRVENGTMVPVEYYVWTDSDGTRHYFVETDEENVYVDEDNLQLKLTPTGSGLACTIEDKDGNSSIFDSEGRLWKQVNNQVTASEIEITYAATGSKLISRIDDGVDRKYNFIYTDGLLSRISYTGTGTTEIGFISFSYTNGNLTKITYQDGKEIHYGYGQITDQPSEGQTLYLRLLTSAQDIDGYLLKYDYPTVTDETWQPYRVSSISEHDGNKTGGALTIQYGHNQTIFTDHSQRQQIMQFNNWGNTTAIQDHEGRAQFLKYSTDMDETAKGNQLRQASKLQNTVGNMLQDISLESNNPWTKIDSAVSTTRTSRSYFLGDMSLKMTRSAAGDPSGVYGRSFTVQPGESYTFSSYVKTGSGATAYLAIAVDGVVVATGETVPASTAWTRKEVSYTNNGDTAVTARPQLMTVTKGTTYFDCVQLEKAPTASRFNRVENGDFHKGTRTWSKSDDCTSADTAVTLESGKCPAAQLDSTVYKIVGDGMSQKRISQTVKVSGSKDGTFVVAGWAKGNSIALSDDGTYQRTFGIRAVFVNTDGTETSKYFPFNPDLGANVWQYTAGVIVAEKAFSSIRIEVLYDHNANEAYFDGIQLFKEEFGSSYKYDANGNVTSVVDLQKQETEYSYTSNKLTQIIQNDKAKMTYTYEGNNVKTATTAEGLLYTFGYDTWGNNTSVTISYDGKSITSQAGYTADGNCLSYTIDALEKQTNYCYNVDTNVLEWVQYPEDTEESRTEYTYDNMYRLAEATQALAEDTVLTAEYTYTNDLLTAIETGSTTYTFGYGAFAQRQSVSIGDRTLAEYEYTNDADRYLSTLIYGNNDSITYTYDGMGRVVKETFEDGSTISYEYNNDGVLANVIDSETGRKTTYYYDLTERLMKYVESGDNYAHSVGYEYDTLNNLTKLVETINGVAHTTEYTYDDDNRVTRITNGDRYEEYIYDEYGRIAQKRFDSYGILLSETFTYADSGEFATSSRIASITTVYFTHTITYSYTYDDNGNILSVCDGTNTTTYTYDVANQLIREDNQEAGKTWTWSYDNAGNILSRNEYAYTVGELGSATDTVTYAYGDADWGDLLTAYDGNTITYDGIGNPLSDGTWSYTWKHGRQLASMTNGEETWTYTYDANGMRASRSDGTTTYEYVYNGSQLVQLTVGETVLSFTYDANGIPQTITENGELYHYITNQQGDVVAIRNGTGALLVSYTYDAWGKVLTIGGPFEASLGFVNPLRYRGYVYDHATGLYYVGSRYYDPEIGRWINADAFPSTGQGMLGNNMFAYCGNNPVVRVDIGGYFWDTVFDVVSLAVSIIEVCVDPQDTWAWIGLAGDVVDLIPFVTCVGEAARAVKTVNKVADSMYDVSRVVDNSCEIIDAAGDVARKTDFYVTPNGEAIPATIDGFNNNLSKLDYQNGKYVGRDSNGPIRIRTNEIHESNPVFTGTDDQFHTILHFHIDRRANVLTGKWGKTYTGAMEMFF